MDCAKAKPNLEAYVSGHVGESDRAEIESHLASCEECSVSADLLRKRASHAEPEQKDWTIEKIFGDSGGTTPGSMPASPPPPPTRSADAPTLSSLFGDSIAPTPSSLTGGPGGPGGAGGSAGRIGKSATAAKGDSGDSMSGGAPSKPSASHSKSDSKSAGAGAGSTGDWGFEPVEADGRVPSEESLLFAEEALGKRSDRSRGKGGAFRFVAWIAGGLVGVGLLGAAIWFAFSTRQLPRSDAKSQPPAPATATTAATAATGTTAATSPPAVPPASSDSAASVMAPPTASGTPNGSTAPSAPTGADTSGLVTAAVRVAVPLPTTPVTPSAGGAEKHTSPGAKLAPGSAKGAAGAAKTPDTVAKLPGNGAKSGAAGSKPSGSRPKSGGRGRDDDDMWPTDDPVVTAPSKPAGTAGAAGGDGAQATSPAPAAAAPAAPAPATPAPISAAPGSTTPPPAAPENPAAPAVMKPIDRLHAATEKAAADADLETLRQLRTTWRNFMRGVVGPDRPRAKREFADCLWAIQTLSGKLQDQREALAAYRDFLLSAPAGAADARSAARLRMLEDALAESN